MAAKKPETVRLAAWNGAFVSVSKEKADRLRAGGSFTAVKTTTTKTSK